MPGMPEGALRALAFDFGLRRTGVAVGQNLSASATSLTVLKMADGVPDWFVIDELIKE
ncbi:MAG: RuvX/YqgF family protein, partial [Gammaproteobacteria bacterium]|nr:RuvX/YqgF family protein [Gammaproteobacteria bacterium]